MPLPSFLANIADKAQSTINASPLATHLPSHNRPNSPDSTAQTPANQTAAQGGSRSHALESISYQIRALGQQYSSTTPAQKIITSEKGVALDFDSVARNSKAQSKEFYTWGQTEAEDLKDVTDRLAYLNFVQGSLSGTLASKLDAARSPFKALRDAETAIAPRRNIRTSLQNQIAKLEHDQQKGGDKRIAEVRDQLRKAEMDDAGQEREIEILKRKAVRESERLKWEAIREYGENLVLLSQAAAAIIAALPSVPPSPENPYTGAQATGAARASLQRALDNYKTGHIDLPSQLAPSELSRSDTQSFGESHASELSTINTPQATLPSSPPHTHAPMTQSSPSIGSPQKIQSPLNPVSLNNSPAPIPSRESPPPPAVIPDASQTSTTVPTITPTVAETGIPVSAGAGGPGPASGSLRDLHRSPLTGSAGQAPRYEMAEEEKRRLAATYSQPVTQSPQAPPAPYESAEEEKNRLEREERERLLHGSSSGPSTQDEKKDKDDELPPYQDL
ncbi:Sphingolipid long chain base-responsive protein LSP1 [Leucoagaricus sp. SymC.cos]|nr:Sphingolipid long chain base-responsive protein LSP1 [Leucoagaricus sp. SymC.cos]